MAGDNDLSKYSSLGQTLIPILNKLQAIFSQLGSEIPFHFPQIAVVGSQSSGKSSVLEALVGRDFLPRGSDICTRRPLDLQLVQISRRSDEDDGEEEWGEFSHLPGRRFTDFSTIRDEIQAETERDVGVNKDISDKQIQLKIFSPYVLNINLVDLPGITKVPVGDQPLDIEDRIQAMIMSYIKHPSCIILAVSPANSDLANSDALQIARIADADGSRTIGVITKLDITHNGTDACNFLLGKENPLQLGNIGVVNQSQKDILANKSIRDALAYEEEFFHSHPVYHSLSGNCGIPQLAKKLNQIFEMHIKVMLPDLKADTYVQMRSVKKELTSYGEVTDSEIDERSLLLDILRKFSDAFTSAIEGKNEETTCELVGGARIQYIFQSVFVKRLEDVDPCEGLSDEDIQRAIQNAIGFKSALFVPEVPFEVLLRRKIALLLDPSLQCVHIIYDELVKLVHKYQTGILLRFPELRRCLEEVLFSFLREGLAKALTIVEHLIEMEMDYINTSHPSFIGGSKAMAAAAQQKRHSVRTIFAHKTKETIDFNRVSGTEKVVKSTSILARASPSRFVTNNVIRLDKSQANGYSFRRSSGISSIFELGESIEYANGGELIPTSIAGEAIHYASERMEILSANGGEAILSANDEESTMSLNGWGAMPSHNGGETIPSSSDNEAILSADGREEIPFVNGVDSILFARGETMEILDPLQNVDPISVSSIIQLNAPPAVLRLNEVQSEQLSIGIIATKILLRSYYDIVRKNIQDRVPKTIMHFLVNHAKHGLYPTLIKNLYREDLFREMFEEQEDIAVRRKQCKNILKLLQQAVCALDELL